VYGRTSPLCEQRVDVAECGEDLERLVEARFVAVERDHHGALEGEVREASITSLYGGVIVILVQHFVERVLTTHVIHRADAETRRRTGQYLRFKRENAAETEIARHAMLKNVHTYTTKTS